MTELIASEPTPGQRITELHCWIATYADGTEGIVAGGIEGIVAGGIEGLGVTTLLSSRHHVAMQLERHARAAMAATARTAHRVVSVRLVTFTTTEGTRQ
jgi:hypothetical protein